MRGKKIGIYKPMKRGKTYYVKVRAVKKIGGTNYIGPWSNIVTVKGR